MKIVNADTCELWRPVKTVNRGTCDEDVGAVNFGVYAGNVCKPREINDARSGMQEVWYCRFGVAPGASVA